MKTTIAALAAFLLAGCGAAAPTADPVAEPTVTAARPVAYDEADVVDHLGLTENPSGLSWTWSSASGSCEVAVVLTTANAVALYADAGDIVATNSDGTAGVKITGDRKSTCRDEMDEALADFS